MLQAVGCIVEDAAEVTGGVVVDQTDGDFFESKLVMIHLWPELHRERIAWHVEVELTHRRNAMSFEAAERIGDVELIHLVENRGDRLVNGSAVTRRQIIAAG